MLTGPRLQTVAKGSFFILEGWFLDMLLCRHVGTICWKILLAREFERVCDLYPDTTFVNFRPIRDLYFPDRSALRAFDGLFPHLSRALCPFFGLLCPLGPPGSKLRAQGFSFNFSSFEQQLSESGTFSRVKLHKKDSTNYGQKRPNVKGRTSFSDT